MLTILMLLCDPTNNKLLYSKTTQSDGVWSLVLKTENKHNVPTKNAHSGPLGSVDEILLVVDG